MRDLEDEYLEGGAVALYSDDLTFEDLANHCKQTKYYEAEYDEHGNKCLASGTPFRILILALAHINQLEYGLTFIARSFFDQKGHLQFWPAAPRDLP